MSNTFGADDSAAAVISVAPLLAPAVSFSTVFSFTGGSDGAKPNGVTQLPNGNLIGTTQSLVCTNSAGTVFQLSTGGFFSSPFPLAAATMGELPLPFFALGLTEITTDRPFKVVRTIPVQSSAQLLVVR